jgi:hypothetical protein
VVIADLCFFQNLAEFLHVLRKGNPETLVIPVVDAGLL